MSNKDLVVFNFHAFGSDADSKYHPWVQDQLESKGITSFTPNLPTPDLPIIKEWIDVATDLLKDQKDKELVVTGRSLGCWSAIKLAEKFKIRTLILVAPTTPPEFEFEGAKNAFGDDRDAWNALYEFVFSENGKVNFDLVKQNVDETIVFLSKDDPYIPLEETREYLQENIENIKFIIKEDANHFNEKGGYDEFSELVDLIVK